MTSKHLRWIGILLAIAVALYLPRVFSDEEGRGTLAVEQGFAFHIADPITRIEIAELADDRVIRLERGQPEWTVDGRRVDQSLVDELLGAIGDLASTNLTARNPANHGALGVSETTGRRIDVYTEGGGPLTFHLGNRETRSGTYSFYVRAPGADEVFLLDSPVGGYLSRARDGWRNRTIAQVDVESVRDIVIRRREGEVVIRKDEDVWMVDGVAADSAAMERLVTMLPALSATGFPSDSVAAATDFAVPQLEVDVFAEGGTDVTDRELVLGLRFVRDEEVGDWLVRAVDGEEVYRLAASTVSRIAPERSDLIPE